MPNTHGVGPFFVHAINLKSGAPFLHTASTDELDPPYRRSDSRIVKIWPGKGLVLGRWIKTGRSEKEALLAATKGRDDVMPTSAIRDSLRFDEVTDDVLDGLYDLL